MVNMPIFFGIVCKKSLFSDEIINTERKISTDLCKKLEIPFDKRSFDEDDQLASWSCGMNSTDLCYSLEILKAAGLTENIDFVIASGRFKVGIPWLTQPKGSHHLELYTKKRHFYTEALEYLKKMIKPKQ